MKIPVSQLQIGLMAYIENEIVPNLPATTIRPFGDLLPIQINQTAIRFISGMGMAYGSQAIENYIPALKSIGIIDAEDMVDVETLLDNAKEQITKIGAVEIANLKFVKEDIDVLKKYLTQNAISI